MCVMHVYVYMMYVCMMCISALPMARVRKLCTSSSPGRSTFEVGTELITSLHLMTPALVTPPVRCPIMA